MFRDRNGLAGLRRDVRQAVIDAERQTELLNAGGIRSRPAALPMMIDMDDPAHPSCGAS